jgi:hypothetical protein
MEEDTRTVREHVYVLRRTGRIGYSRQQHDARHRMPLPAAAAAVATRKLAVRVGDRDAATSNECGRTP